MTEPTTLLLIRHGETEWNRLGRYQGTTDVPLNDAGREQARRLAESLAGVPIDAACSSPLSRALQTAGAVLGERGTEVLRMPELREVCYGDWQGREILPHGRWDPELEDRWRDDPWTVRFPGGESLPEVRRRAAAALRRIREMHPGRTVLVSGHGHLNRVLLIEALGWPPERFWIIEQPNACLYRLRSTDEETWTLLDPTPA